jgi:hypothetical protein
MVSGTGDLRTKQGFGDVQLHLEFSTPEDDEDISQGRGNSGIFLMGRYEVQILDSYQNKTYPDGQCAAIYSQYLPLVNASRPSGEWQTFDIVFRHPHFDEEEQVIEPARMTVFHNGVLVQDNVELTGPTAYRSARPTKHMRIGFPLSFRTTETVFGIAISGFVVWNKYYTFSRVHPFASAGLA